MRTEKPAYVYKFLNTIWFLYIPQQTGLYVNIWRRRNSLCVGPNKLKAALRLHKIRNTRISFTHETDGLYVNGGTRSSRN
jgi:hypothetical protein